ncbi:MAG TPA: hypothetical protein VJA17_04280 [Candidatus Omnitrophota bacterium]|nr:hypothetical protein [Candidatus Omnitrophota bacterium]
MPKIFAAAPVVIGLLFFALSGGAAEQSQKSWSGAGDGVSWSDDQNWSSGTVPVATDDVLVNTKDVAVMCTETFQAKSVTLGGSEPSSLTSSNFVFGAISSGSGSAPAVLNRSGGLLKLNGAGTMTLKGQYRSSEEIPAPEPSFLFWIK